MEILGLIPARGGSKGIPKKNIQLLCGKPLIAYVIEKALKCKYINKLVVSTDDPAIAKIAKEYGAEVPFMRPSYLSTDKTPMLPVVKHTLDWLFKNQNYIPDVVVLLQANSPLMRASDIDKVIQKLINTNADVVYTVTKVEHPPQWLQTLKGDIPSFVFDESKIKKFDRRQDLKEIFRSTGAISAVRVNYFLRNYKKKPRLALPKKGQKSRVIITDSISSLDIDTWLDLWLAETILKKGLLHE
jgi:N-acylneuraminate cytidylyltransferase/CMP-N,N'-diacetyllegionaminic acid synthase